LAVWLVAHLTYGRSEAVLGDLLERFAQGETVSWFWRQALCALAVSFKTVMRLHGLSFAAALAAASTVMFAVHVLSSIVLTVLFRTLAPRTPWPWWILKIPWYERPWRFALASMYWERIPDYLAYVAAGWTAVRIYRPHPVAIVTVFAALYLAMRMPWTIRLTHALITNSRYMDAWLSYCGWTAATTLSILIAGFWAARRPEFLVPAVTGTRSLSARANGPNGARSAVNSKTAIGLICVGASTFWVSLIFKPLHAIPDIRLRVVILLVPVAMLLLTGSFFFIRGRFNEIYH
jgi:hypothetical protein